MKSALQAKLRAGSDLRNPPNQTLERIYLAKKLIAKRSEDRVDCIKLKITLQALVKPLQRIDSS